MARLCWETSVPVWLCKAATSLGQIEQLWQHFSTKMEPTTTNKNNTTNPPWELQNTFVSLSPISECRFVSNRLKCIGCHLSTPNPSFCVLISLPLTTTINLHTIRNFLASCKESRALNLTSWREASTSDVSL